VGGGEDIKAILAVLPSPLCTVPSWDQAHYFLFLFEHMALNRGGVEGSSRSPAPSPASQLPLGHVNGETTARPGGSVWNSFSSFRKKSVT